LGRSATAKKKLRRRNVRKYIGLKPQLTDKEAAFLRRLKLVITDFF
jgi:hypothetical protein